MSTPDKAALQKYLQERHASKTPPPSPEEIRRQLGWGFKTDRGGR